MSRDLLYLLRIRVFLSFSCSFVGSLLSLSRSLLLFRLYVPCICREITLYVVGWPKIEIPIHFFTNHKLHNLLGRYALYFDLFLFASSSTSSLLLCESYLTESIASLHFSVLLFMLPVVTVLH